MSSKVKIVIVFVLVSVLFIASGIKAKAPLKVDNAGKQEQQPFIPKLESLLNKGVRSGDRHAIVTLCAMFWTDDPELVNCACRVIGKNFEKTGRKVLDRSLKEFSNGRIEMKSSATGLRSGRLCTIAREIGDGKAYLRVLVFHLKSPKAIVRAQPVSRLNVAHSFLSKVFGKNEKPPNVLRNAVFDRKEAEKSVALWEQWLEKVDEKRLNTEMKKLFAHCPPRKL